jgi:hypothetical protein
MVGSHDIYNDEEISNQIELKEKLRNSYENNTVDFDF